MKNKEEDWLIIERVLSMIYLRLHGSDLNIKQLFN